MSWIVIYVDQIMNFKLIYKKRHFAVRTELVNLNY